MRQIFKSPVHQKTFDQFGYVIVPFLEKNEVSDILSKFGNLPDLIQKGFFSTLFASDSEYKKNTHEILLDFGQKAVSEFLHEYKVLALNFITKTNGPDGEMPPHQDWNFVDEEKFRSINMWCPLVDVDQSNGALYILSKGQNIPPTIRGTGTPNAFSKIKLGFENLTLLPMKAGEVLFYDHRMIHSSPPNMTSKTRVAFGGPAIPYETEPIHYFVNEEKNRLEKYQVSVDFFFDYTYGQKEMPRDSSKFLEDTEPVFSFIEERDISPLMGRKKLGFFQRFKKSIMSKSKA